MITYKVNNYPGTELPPMGGLLSYNLQSVGKGLVFQVTGQHPLVTEFLTRNKFQASTGLCVDISKYPEYKESGLTVYLRGNDVFQNEKLDATWFHSDRVRDDRKARIEQTLRELVSTVKKAYAPVFAVPQTPRQTMWNCYPAQQFGW